MATPKQMAATIADLEELLRREREALRTERAIAHRLQLRLDTLTEQSRQVDLLYQNAESKLATVRIALEAPNLCDIVEWALRVKRWAGRMPDDIYSQAARAGR